LPITSVLKNETYCVYEKIKLGWKARRLGSWEARRLGEKEPIAYK